MRYHHYRYIPDPATSPPPLFAIDISVRKQQHQGIAENPNCVFKTDAMLRLVHSIFRFIPFKVCFVRMN